MGEVFFRVRIASMKDETACVGDKSLLLLLMRASSESTSPEIFFEYFNEFITEYFKGEIENLERQSRSAPVHIMHNKRDGICARLVAC